VGVLIIVTLVGSTGLIAAWAGIWPGTEEEPVDGSVAFFALLMQLPNWVVGVVLVMSVALSTAAFDSFQSAMVTSASNDLFRNRLNIWWIRAGVVLVMIPVVVIGLSDACYWWRGFEVVVGGLGGLFTVFLFGTVYYGDAQLGAELMLLQQGLYTDDWGAFGAFVAAPVGGILWGFGALALRIGFQYVRARLSGKRFDALDRPIAVGGPQLVDPEAGRDSESSSDAPGIAKSTGKFF
jgi:Flp pilus assembly protein protease CpaA